MVSEKLKEQAEKLFLKQYPNADISKFIFGYNLNDDSSLKSTVAHKYNIIYNCSHQIQILHSLSGR